MSRIGEQREQYLVGPAGASADAGAALQDFMREVGGMTAVTVVRPYQDGGSARAVVQTDRATIERLRERFRGRLLFEVDAPLRL